MSETLTTIFEESSASSSTLENFQEEGAQQLHETCDIDSAETKPSKNDPNSSRSFNKFLNFSRFTSFFRPNATSPLTTTSNHDYHDIHDDHNEMLALRERVATVENLVEKQQLEIDTLRRTQDPNPVGS
ncbi:hypothetical protein GBA52_026969 [Prunus armeniaca]|nr:hypothetical protein GBA52_026969 [Prunus armeniaca]